MTATESPLAKVSSTIRRFSSIVRISLASDRPKVCFAADCVDVSI